jgi:hypothetical protein
MKIVKQSKRMLYQLNSMKFHNRRIQKKIPRFRFHLIWSTISTLLIIYDESDLLYLPEMFLTYQKSIDDKNTI